MTTTRVQEIVGQVRTRNQAQSIIAELLQNWGTDMAFTRLQGEAVFAKQATCLTVSFCVSQMAS